MPATIRLPEPGCAAVHAALIASMIGPSLIRLIWFGSSGDWPCLAVMMIAVFPRVSGLAWIASSNALSCASSQSSASLSSGPGVIVPGRYPPSSTGPPMTASDESSFSAVEIVWKFIPKIAGVPTLWVPLWS